MARPGRNRALWGVRLVEWGILALVALGFSWALGHYAQRVQALAERASVLTTLGALRTALVLRHLQDNVPRTPSAPLPALQNPFDALERTPANYAGAIRNRDVAATPAGQWVFDGACRCVGYKPLYAETLTSRDQLPALWFQLQSQGTVLHLVPLDDYQWLGERVR